MRLPRWRPRPLVWVIFAAACSAIMLYALQLPWRARACAAATTAVCFIWLSGVCHYTVGALLPLVLYPLLGVLSAKETAAAYYNDTIALFLSTFIMAVALEQTGLHKRIALSLLSRVGRRPAALLGAFMLSTFAVSMWCSNIATTGAMLPVARACFDGLLSTAQGAEGAEGADDVEGGSRTAAEGGSVGDEGAEQSGVAAPASAEELLHVEESDEGDDVPLRPSAASAARLAALRQLAKGGTLSIAYSASLGGVATLTGTGPNVVLRGAFAAMFPSAPQLGYAQWFSFAAPTAAAALFVAWLLFCRVFIASGLQLPPSAALRRRYQQLGAFSGDQAVVTAVWLVMVAAWFFRRPGLLPHGWSWSEGISDATVGMTCAMSLFFFPTVERHDGDEPARTGGQPRQRKPARGILYWPAVAERIPWSLFLLMGGGFAIADAFRLSGLSQAVGVSLAAAVAGLSPLALVFLISLICSLLTELTSNVATTTVLLPVLASLALSLRLHPLLLLVPATVSTSFAFMTPIATPPNAMVFATQLVPAKTMASVGLLLDLLCVVLLTASFMLLGLPVFHIDLASPPTWLLS